MIGSPAARGAVISFGCAAWRGFFAAASALSGAKATIAASVTMVGAFQRRIATADCVIANRSRMACPVEMPVFACVDRLPDRDSWTINNSVIHAPFVAKDYRRDSVANPFIQLTWKEGGSGGQKSLGTAYVVSANGPTEALSFPRCRSFKCVSGQKRSSASAVDFFPIVDILSPPRVASRPHEAPGGGAGRRVGPEIRPNPSGP